MDKLKMHTPDFTDENIARIAELFPGCVTEAKDADGNLTKAIDFDQLKQELSGNIVEGPQERYHLDWPGKREALLTANAPIAKTLRPSRDESVDFDTTKNLYIEGDNLDALKLLQETYLGKVKMIYIDPPYNTGNDFIYEDDFAEDKDVYFVRSTQKDEEGNRLAANTESNGRFHSDWLSMLYPRLRLARNLLKDDGVIFVSVDDNEAANLMRLCGEVFGEQNYLGTLVWNKQHSQQQGIFKRYHEYVFVWAREAANIQNISGGEGIIDAGALKKISRANPASEFTFPAGVRFEAEDDIEYAGTYGDSEKVTVVSGRLRCKDGKTSEAVTLSAGWTQKNQMHSYFADKETFDSKGQKVIEFYFTAAGKLKCQKVRSKITPPSILPGYGTVSAQTEYLERMMGTAVFPNPKPVNMISDFISWFVQPDEIVLDFFAGSSTTAESAMRQALAASQSVTFIMVQLPEILDEDSSNDELAINFCDSQGLAPNISEISKERIRRAGKKIKEEAGLMGADLDIGFRVLKVDTSNMKDVYYSPDTADQQSLLDQVTNIKEDRTPEDLLFQVLLDWGVDLTLPISRQIVKANAEGGMRKAEFEVFFVDENALVCCFDTGITEELVKELAKRQPLRVVFRDSGFVSDSVKINTEQIFKQMSSGTEVKTI